jgi:uncharacterized protein YfiM (DUF2279 family)
MKASGIIKFIVASVVISTFVAACGGGGGGHHDSGGTISYPYETVYGDICVGYQPTPGCTFNKDGSRVKVSQDPDYNKYGYGSDDLWYVKFDSNGNADVYNDLGQYQYTRSVSDFAGWVGGNTIGVGTTGLYWENVSGGTYWFGKNGVLYSANSFSSNYGQAINNKTAGQASDTSFAALNSDANVRLVKLGTQKLMKDYGFNEKKATAVASALNSWAVAGAERGYTTDKDMDKTFKSVFGVDFYSALSAVKELQAGNTASMRDLTDRSAAALGLRPDQAQKFVKGMYKKALAQWGIDAESINW